MRGTTHIHNDMLTAKKVLETPEMKRNVKKLLVYSPFREHGLLHPRIPRGNLHYCQLNR